MSDKQTSDSQNKANAAAAGTSTTSLTPKPTSAESIAPSGNSTSGSSQGTSRGKQGMGS